MTAEKTSGINPDIKGRHAAETVDRKLKENIPTKTDFLTYDLPDEVFAYGIVGSHGKKHTGRTIFIGMLITNILKQQNPELEINEAVVSWSLAWHDTQRTEDPLDCEHGEKAASVLEKDPSLPPYEHREKVIKNVRNHDIPRSEIPPSDMSIEAQIVRAADALDRVRFEGNTDVPHHSLDPNRLPLQEISLGLIPLARELYRRTQDGEESFTQVANAAIEMGHMKEE